MARTLSNGTGLAGAPAHAHPVLAASGAPSPARTSKPDALRTLTPREREVLSWVAAGKSNAQIGAILGARPRTVAKHLERVYEKLGVETRTAAAMRAVQSRPGLRLALSGARFAARRHADTGPTSGAPGG